MATSSQLKLSEVLMLLTSVLAAGMIFRGKRGIGFEGLAILLIYIAGFSIVFFL